MVCASRLKVAGKVLPPSVRTREQTCSSSLSGPDPKKMMRKAKRWLKLWGRNPLVYLQYVCRLSMMKKDWSAFTFTAAPLIIG